jgi:hypothetical protein
MKILETMINKQLILFESVYVKDANIHYHIYDNSIYITDLLNALKVGKTVKQIVINDRFSHRLENLNIYQIMEDNSIKDYNTFFKKALEGSLRLHEKLDFNTREHKGINTYSPFVIQKKIKIPKKWKISDIWKSILSGQITKGIKTMHLTDDYGGDAACNFEKGKKLDLQYIAQQLIEHKSGYWINIKSEDNEKVILGLNCHQFDYNELTFDKTNKR